MEFFKQDVLGVADSMPCDSKLSFNFACLYLEIGLLGKVIKIQ